MSGGLVIISRVRRWAWWTGTGVVLLAVAAVLLVGPYQFLLGNVAGSTAEPARLAPCLPGEPVRIMDSPHISEAEMESVEYNSLPPTSGPHYPFVASTGIYDRPIADGLTVHALEHGHIAIQYAPDLADDQVQRLTQLAKRHGNDVILAPYPALEEGIALTAWGRIDLLHVYDELRINEFVEELRGRYSHGWTTEDDCP